MRWILPNGRLIWRNDNKYLINWNKPSRSKEQTKVKEFLKDFWQQNIIFEEYLLPASKLRVDFLNATKKIAWEHQGDGAHGDNKFSSFFFKNSRLKYLASIKRDVKKMKLLELNGYTVIETFTKDLDNLNKEFFREQYNLIL